MIQAVLDTQVWIWCLVGSSRIKPSLQKRLKNPKNIFGISSISVWELTKLYEKGRIELNPSLDSWLNNAFESFPVEDLPVNREIARLQSELKFEHSDPADMLIATTAYFWKVPLITSDKELLKLSWLNTEPV